MQTNLDKVLGPHSLCCGKLNSLGVIKTSLLSIQPTHTHTHMHTHTNINIHTQHTGGSLSRALSLCGSCTDEQQRRHKLNEAWLHADFQPESAMRFHICRTSYA